MLPTSSYLISPPCLTQIATPVTVANQASLAVLPTIAYENPVKINTLYQPLCPPVCGYDVDQVLKYQQMMENEKLIDLRIKEKVNSQIEKYKTQYLMENQLENKINECKQQKACCQYNQNDSIIACKCKSSKCCYQNECRTNARDTSCCSNDSCCWENQKNNTKLCCSSNKSINDSCYWSNQSGSAKSCCSSNQCTIGKSCCSGNQNINDSCYWSNRSSNAQSCCSGNQSNNIQKCCCAHETKRRESSTCTCGDVACLDDKIERIRKELNISGEHKKESSCVHFCDHREIVTPDRPKIVYPSNTKYEVTHERPSRSRSRSKSANSRRSSRSLSPGSRPLWKPTGANDYSWANETRSKMINENYPVRPKSATNEPKSVEIPIKYIDSYQRPQTAAVYDHYVEYHLNRDRELKSHSKVQMHKIDSNGHVISQSYTNLRSLSPPAVEKRVTWKPIEKNDSAWSTLACKSTTTDKPLTSTTTVYTTTKKSDNLKSSCGRKNIPVTIVNKTIRHETRTRSQSPPNNYYYNTSSQLINSQVPKTSIEKKIAVNTNRFYNTSNNSSLKNYNTNQSAVYYTVEGPTTNTNKFYNTSNNSCLKNYNTNQSSIYYTTSGTTTNANKESFKLY